MRKVSCFVFALLLTVIATAQTKLEGLSGNVEVRYDEYGVPHIFADKWLDAVRALGYIHATDRLFQMDVTRRTASGTLSEILGEGALEGDIRVRQLGLRRTCEAFWEQGNYPDALRDDLEAYCAGVNAKIAELGADGLPMQFKALEYAPAPWTPVDCIVFGKYMAWDQSGSDDDLWFGVLLEKFGPQAFEELWPLDRPYEVPAVKQQVNDAAVAKVELTAIPGAADAYLAALGTFDATWLGRGGSFGSNNWAVAGSKTKSGKPILCSDPHLGFSLPSIWYTAHLSAEGRNLAGVTFAGSPSVVIGHNDHLGWGITNLQADAVDYFVETVDANDPLKYMHRGEWKTMERISEEVPVKGAAPHKLDIDYTVHGPVISREGRVIAMQWTDLGVTSDALAIFGMNRATNLQEWLAAARTLVAPGINLMYADKAGNIALYCAGSFPLRLHGQGRVPMDGASGENDWVGMIPKDQMPLAINPAEGFVMSANGRPASIGYPHYLGFQWDPSARTRRINDMLSGAGDLSIESMAPIQNDAHDKFAETFLPVFLRVMAQSDAGDLYSARLLAALSQWDYVADRDSIGTIIWLRWFDAFRAATWDDEFAARGIEKRGGSWGFSGDNKREPMLEVLEYMTRENPDSIWFDDRATPEREDRNAIIQRAFVTASAQLKTDIGEDLTKYAWRNFNVLRIDGLLPLPIPGVERDGGPVVGDSFTVNPGGDGGGVGGGASWRMIVDFGDLTTSVGTYPGGQSEDLQSPHYADQMALWASGTYAPLRMVSDIAALPA
ncbi:MAG TPA: penicillin acylase family protein, partial [Candidatus Hydrogenedentes bacterium]|nr:penicillin acylase family protein [Candidatus Hydrogenedentota bacterium]